MANPNTIIGRIHSIGQTVNVSKKENAFYKRELVLNASRFDPYTGEERKNIVALTFAQKNCEKLNGFQQGELVEVSFILQGREYQPQGGGVKYITDVVAYNIERKATQGNGNATQAPQAPVAPQAPAAHTTTQTYAPQPQYAPQQEQPQYQQPAPQKQGGDLPF